MEAQKTVFPGMLYYYKLSANTYQVFVILMNSVVEFSRSKTVMNSHLKHTVSTKTTDSETSEDEQLVIENPKPILKIPQQIKIELLVIPEYLKNTEKTVEKMATYTSSLTNCDKTIRMGTSIIKILKAFELISELTKKRINGFSKQLSTARKVIQLNGKWTCLRQLLDLSKKPKWDGQDKFDFIFGIFQLIAELNDTLCFLIRLKLFGSKIQDACQQLSSDFYFYQCFIKLMLNTVQYLRMRQKAKNLLFSEITKDTIKSHYKKLLNIVKYVLDSLTSHNDFRGKLFDLDPKLSAIFATISSIIGIYSSWK